MLPVKSIRLQLEAFLNEAERISFSEFPYHHSQEALSHISIRCKQLLVIFDNLKDDSDPVVTEDLVIESAEYLQEAIPTLGFILRSTNVRNAFEFHGPMLRLTRVLESTKSIILSQLFQAAWSSI
jgi:hypothetical protein